MIGCAPAPSQACALNFSEVALLGARPGGIPLAWFLMLVPEARLVVLFRLETGDCSHSHTGKQYKYVHFIRQLGTANIDTFTKQIRRRGVCTSFSCHTASFYCKPLLPGS